MLVILQRERNRTIFRSGGTAQDDGEVTSFRTSQLAAGKWASVRPQTELCDWDCAQAVDGVEGPIRLMSSQKYRALAMEVAGTGLEIALEFLNSHLNRWLTLSALARGLAQSCHYKRIKFQGS